MNLSKSLYTKGIQCPKALWLKKYRPEVLTPPDAAAEAVFETGNIVGDLACKLFPEGKEVPYSENFDEMIQTTASWLDEGLKYIYEATFSYQGILVMVDILQIDSDGVHIYEVKSSTSLKDIYLHDISIQYYVLHNLGFHIKSAHLIHLNKEYIRKDHLVLQELFTIVDVTADVTVLQTEIPQILEAFDRYLHDRENEPNIDIAKHCMKPYKCDAKEYCWKVQRAIPEYSIFDIFNLGSKKQQELYSQGIVRVEDIPDDFAMTQRQKEMVRLYKSKVEWIDKKKIKAFLDRLSYPIYHLDFETYQQAIPLFSGVRPFMQIPFQYSMHVEYENKELQHYEFLAESGSDPRRALAEKLCMDIPRDVTVLAYNMSFEKGVIEKLALEYADLREHLMAIHDNIQDLMYPFQKRYYVTPSMQGRYSIKYVLPALVPEMQDAYKALDGIHNGSEAMNAFANLEKLPIEEQKRVRQSLLEYCKLDTLAMVKVLEKLREAVDD